MVETNDGDEWITLAAASERSGLSVDALRRQVKRGRLPSRQEQTRYGPTWLVSAGALPSVSARVEGAPRVGATVGAEGGAAMVALVEYNRELKDELVQKAEAAAMWQARAEMLAGELGRAREQLALMAPAQPAVVPDSALEPAIPPESTQHTPVAPSRTVPEADDDDDEWETERPGGATKRLPRWLRWLLQV